MSRTDGLDIRRATASRSSTPATSPRRQQTPRKMARGPTATPGAGAGTPATGRTPLRTRSGLPSRSERSRAAARACAGVHSEPSSPRGFSTAVASAACSSLADSLGGALEDLLLSPPDDAPTPLSLGSAAPDRLDNNIHVFVRVRPSAARTCVSCPPGGHVVVLADPCKPEPFTATFDGVLGPAAGQEEVYAAVGAQMVDNVMQGFNSSIFVYGQTGAGKTHTITGDAQRCEDGSLAEQCGLTLRVFRQLFERITCKERDGVRYTVKCCACEVYNEELSDLLAPGGASGLQIRDGDHTQGVFVENLSQHIVVNADDVMGLIQRGAANRHTAATRMNERSSRSHSVFTAVVEAHEEQEESGVTRVQFAKLNLIDLAGSERVGKSGATGERLTEAKGINKSLTTLGRVVSALTERQQHVPYRDSKLTFLLKESLGGNSKTSIVACVSPCEESVTETHSTLVFAAGAKKIRNRAVVNQDMVGDIKALQLENARLQRELAKREDVLSAELLQRAAAAQAQAAHAEERVAAAERRQQQLEVALNEEHATLQQRNAELALVKKEAEEGKAGTQLLQRDREELIDHNATLTERVEALQAGLELSKAALRESQQDVAAALERCEAASAVQRASEDEARVLRLDRERLAADVARVSDELESVRRSKEAELAQAAVALEESDRSKRALRREVEQLLGDLRARQREVAAIGELAAAKEGRLRAEVAELSEAAAARAAQLQELEGRLAVETVRTAKYHKMVGEIGKLIDWAHSTSPLPPTLGGRTSPAGFSSLRSFGSGRLSLGGAAPVSPLGDATNQRLPAAAAPGRSPGKRQVQVASPAGRTPMQSPSKVR